MKRVIDSDEKIAKLILKPADPGYALVVFDNSEVSTGASSDQEKKEGDEKKEGEGSSTTAGDSAAPGDARDSKPGDAKTDAGKDVVARPGAPCLGTHVRLLDLFLDEVFFDLWTDVAVGEHIAFLSLHPNADAFILGTNLSISLWDYGACLRAGVTAASGDKKGDADKALPGPVCSARAPTYGSEICATYDTQGICFAMGVGNG